MVNIISKGKVESGKHGRDGVVAVIIFIKCAHHGGHDYHHCNGDGGSGTCCYYAGVLVCLVVVAALIAAIIITVSEGSDGDGTHSCHCAWCCHAGMVTDTTVSCCYVHLRIDNSGCEQWMCEQHWQ